ncbi:MAG TPA: acyltransferase, partial [Solirubrobacteraceae bacterium]|nr:acyltransferase [Solirubrobacteraceae bacterium]
MGLFRLILSLVVVLFHFGGLSPLSGRIAVFAFYVLSGYLMALVLERVYGATAAGAGRFYLNRALRLLPLMGVYAAAAVVLLAVRDDRGFAIDPTEALFHPYSREQEGLGIGFHVQALSDPLVLRGDFVALPQAWSLATEGFFYLLAPLLMALWLRHWARPLFFVVLAASAALHVVVLAGGDDFDLGIYRNFLTSLCVFQAGMLLHLWRDRLTLPGLPAAARKAAAGVLVVAFVVLATRFPELALDVGFYLGLALALGIVALLGPIRDWPRWFVRLDKPAGDLAYGVFINHFVAAALLLVLAEYLQARGHGLAPFGRVNGTEFGVWTAALSLALAGATFLLVERPLERGRSRIRGVAISPAPEAPLVA